MKQCMKNARNCLTVLIITLYTTASATGYTASVHASDQAIVHLELRLLERPSEGLPKKKMPRSASRSVSHSAQQRWQYILSAKLRANQALSTVQKPEKDGKRVFMRFVGVRNAIAAADLAAIADPETNFLTSLLAEERVSSASILTTTYRFLMTIEPDSAVVQRRSSTETLVLIYLTSDKKLPNAGAARSASVADKPSAASDKPADKSSDKPSEKLDKSDKSLDKPSDKLSDKSASDAASAEPPVLSAKGRTKWSLDVIVIDPGHGGKDAGAVGVSGVREKDVVLSIAKKLGALITKQMPGTKVVYTRSDDTFVELDRRGQIANEAGGKLFISIHCNSTPHKPSAAQGFEVYILRPGKTADAVRVAEFENSVVKFEANAKRYKELTDEQFIIVNMAQSAFVKFSDAFAGFLTREVEKTTPLHIRGVNQAGFYVLVGASMPNVLIETAFLSNKKDERYLASDKGQRQLAQGMLNAIKAYRSYYERQLGKE
jgi:N-acetylmuramoyl-L-alanine amidase